MNPQADQVESDVPTAALAKKRTFKKFSYKGVDLETLLEMPTDDLVKPFPARIQRRFAPMKDFCLYFCLYFARLCIRLVLNDWFLLVMFTLIILQVVQRSDEEAFGSNKNIAQCGKIPCFYFNQYITLQATIHVI